MLTLPLAMGLGLAVVATSFLSGLFGMAGGMVLMGVLLMMLPVGAAMLLHGITQMTANGWRAWLWRRHIRWGIVGRFLAGGSVAVAVFALLAYVPGRAVSLIVLGLSPFLALAIPGRWSPDVTRRGHAETAGVLCMGIQLVAGISGPLLDAFFVRTGLTRQSIVATKAAVQVAGHLVKVVYFGALASGAAAEAVTLPAVALCVAMAVLGTTLARGVLEAMSDARFRTWSQRLITLAGAVYLGQGVFLLVAPLVAP
ncbi:sulfite exporter TauE/SafE family protein [Azospirillum halopraeferens]|uniref:sulfite exporter TauE/SafE family protein n=1 Tax=Azospirillum halopraeferens TaxID=34010 RepID=UPI0004130893|nr:sulfite exporter TauE/SafE family protein [Azospirillum halopraeferens]